ncbi:MAG: chromate transporter [Rikenellaceae bacterium]
MEQTVIKSEVKLRDLFWSFLKIGAFTFGGGYAMIALIEREVVERRGWIAKEDFIGLLTLAQSVPGPIALNSAAFIGYKSRGYIGTLSALFGVVIPSFLIILVVAIFFSTIRDNAIVEAAFMAMRPVVVALIVAPTLAMMRAMKPIPILITIAAIATYAYFELSPIYPIIAAGVVGAIWTRVFKSRIRTKR